MVSKLFRYTELLSQKNLISNVSKKAPLLIIPNHLFNYKNSFHMIQKFEKSEPFKFP